MSTRDLSERVARLERERERRRLAWLLTLLVLGVVASVLVKGFWPGLLPWWEWV